MGYLGRTFPPLGADFMRIRIIISGLSWAVAGSVLCNGGFDLVLYVFGSVVAFASGVIEGVGGNG